MKKSKECIVQQNDNFQLIHYTYYFKTNEEWTSYRLKDNERLLYIYYLMDETSEFKLGMKVEEIRLLPSHLKYSDDKNCARFVKNL